MMRISILSALFVILVFTSRAHAEPFPLSRFSSAATIETFQALEGLPGNVPEVVLNGATYTVTGEVIRFLGSINDGPQNGNECYGGIGRCIATSTSDLETLWITFDQAVARAGLWVGLGTYQWSADVAFFDTSDTLLGTVSLGAWRGHQFAGWESEEAAGQLIKRIAVIDTFENSRVTAIDSVTTERHAVPEPTTLLLVGVGFAAMIARLRQRT